MEERSQTTVQNPGPQVFPIYGCSNMKQKPDSGQQSWVPDCKELFEDLMISCKTYLYL